MKLSVGCTARPGRAGNNKTGSWRVFRPRFHHKECSQCGICAMLCPESCVKADGECFTPDYTYCKGCGICAEECPSGDVTMEKEEK